jgi:hypothetical protein
MKATVSVVNTTQRLNQGGRVITVDLDQRLALPASPDLMTESEWLSVSNAIKGLRAVERPMDGAELAKAMTRSAAIVDRPSYETYREWQGSEGNTTGVAAQSTAPNAFESFFSTIANWEGSVHFDRPMSTRVILFSAAPIQQSYAVDIRGAWYTRWPANNILADHTTPVPHIMSGPENGNLRGSR